MSEVIITGNIQNTSVGTTITSSVENGVTLQGVVTTGGVGPTGPPGTTDHTLLSNIGTNTHAQIDTAITSISTKANDSDVVHDTGDETIAGVKTFTSDPLIPDEVYGAGWNGVLEPPTKNAVYDKIEAHEADTTSVHGITDTSTLYRSGGTDVAIADGGTGASTASAARTNLGLQAKTFVTVGTADADYICDGTADNVEIQAAIDAVSTAGGGDVYLKRGTYAISAVVNLASNVNLTGDRGGTLLNLATATTLKVSAKSQITISNLKINGNSQATTNYGILIENSSDVIVRDCLLTTMNGFGIFIAASVANTCERITISDNYLLGNGNADVIGGGPTNSTGASVANINITGNYIIQDCTTNTYDNVFDIVAVNRVSFTNNVCRGRVQFGTEQFPNIDSKISNNILYPAINKTTTVILVTTNLSATSSGDGIAIIGNNLKEGGIKCTGIAGQTIKRLTIVGNVVKAQPILNGIELSYCSQGVVSGNTISNATAGVYFENCDNFDVSGNQINSCTYGIRDITGIATILIGNNQLSSVATPYTGGTSDLPVADGGTGASTAANALINFGLTATATELNALDGITSTVTELNYTDGVTSSIQTQLDTKVQLASDLSGSITAPVTTTRTITKTVSRSSTIPGDYVCDGVLDDVQIQAAVDAVFALGGGTVVIRANTNPYRIGATIVVPQYVRIVGEKFVKGSSGGTTLKTSASVTLTNMFTMTGLTATDPVSNTDLHHDTGFEHMTFDGNNTTTSILHYTNQDYSKIDHCRFIQATNAIKTTWDSSVDPTATTIPGGLRIDNCLISSVSGIGIDLQYQTQCWITNCWFTGTSVSAWINFKSSNKIHIANCEFNTATTALSFSDTATVACNDITIADCIFVGGKAITDTRTHASSDRVFITGIQSTGTNDTLVGDGNIVALSGTAVLFDSGFRYDHVSKTVFLSNYESAAYGEPLNFMSPSGTLAGENGDDIYLTAGEGAAAGAGGSGGDLAIGAGSAGGSGNNNGGGVEILLGSSTGSGTNGRLVINQLSGSKAIFSSDNLTADRTFTFPDSTGTLALTSQITGTNSGTNTGDQTSIVGITGTTAQFNTALTDNDFATLAGTETLSSKTLTTPVLGVATATSINKVAITAPATSATLTIANGKTLTTNNSITLSGTDATVMTFPAASDTVAGLAAVQTITGAWTFNDTKLVLAGATSGTTVFKSAAIAASSVITLPSGTDTLVGKATTDTLTNKTLTSPSITTPTGIVKGDVGLGNVDNTSDATKQADLRTLNRTSPFISNDFLNTSSVTPFAALAIASGTGNSPLTISAAHPGVYRARSSTTTNSGIHLGTNTAQILLAGGEEFEAIFQAPLVAGSTLRIGFHDTATSADAVDGCYVEIPDTGICTGKTSNNSTRSSTGTTYTVVTATWYRVRIVLNSAATSVSFTLFNEAGTSLWTDSLATNIPTAVGRETGAGIVGTNVNLTAVDVYMLDYMSLFYNKTLVR